MELRLDQVTKCFDEKTVLTIPSLVVPSGMLTCIVGPRGAGKTTLVRLIAGLDAPSSGTVVGDDRALNDVASDERGIVMASPEELADVLPSSVVLLDEPLDGLSGERRRSARDEIRQRQAETGATVVCATEDQGDALALAERVVVLGEGRVHQVGPPSAVFDRPATTLVASYFGVPPMNVVPGILEKDGVAVEIGPRSLQLNGMVEQTYARDVFLGIRPEHVRLGARSTPGWRGTVSRVEPIADGLAVEVTVDMGEFVAREDTTSSYEVGDVVSLSLPSKHLHVFDERGGRLDVV